MVQTTTTDAEDTENADEDQGDDEPDTFPRSYVVKLRSENARYRERARNADVYAKRLHTELVRATGGWPTRPTSSSPRTTSTTPTPWPPRSTTCWPASHTLRRADQSAK